MQITEIQKVSLTIEETERPLRSCLMNYCQNLFLELLENQKCNFVKLFSDEVQKGEERRVELSVLHPAADSGDAARQRSL